MALWRASSRSNSLWRAIRLSFASERLYSFWNDQSRMMRVGRQFFAHTHLQKDWRMRVANPTNAVSGSFIPHRPTKGLADGRCESHQRSWWFVHTQPTMQQPAQQFL